MALKIAYTSIRFLDSPVPSGSLGNQNERQSKVAYNRLTTNIIRFYILTNVPETCENYVIKYKIQNQTKIIINFSFKSQLPSNLLN